MPASVKVMAGTLSATECFDHARFFALCAEHRGFYIEAFASYEEAMEWLLGEPAQ